MFGSKCPVFQPFYLRCYIVAMLLGTTLLSAFVTLLRRRIISRQSRHHMTYRAARLAAIWSRARTQKAKIAEERQRVAEGMLSHTRLSKAGKLKYAG